MEDNKRNILITGGTGKIGSVLVSQMIRDGHNVVFTSTNYDKSNLLINSVKAKKGKLFCCKLDLEDDLQGLKKFVNDLPIKIDCIIHNARSIETLKIQSNGLSDSSDILREFKIGVISPYIINNLAIEYSHPLLDIIYISSMYGFVGPNKNLYDDFHHESPIQYGLCKSAQIHSVKELAIRLSEKSIRVNAISYGGVEGRAGSEFVERYNKLNPSGRMLTDKDLYPPIQLILNNKQLNITGENIKIDGGWTIW
jgi:NAD(P)-dependent dehydrogenase (short-subunit alcohol dehydrogenase family)